MANMNIKILGTGCTNCKNLLETTKQAVKEMNVDASRVCDRHEGDREIRHVYPGTGH